MTRKSEPVLVERILLDQRFDLLSALADGQDDPAVARNLPAGDQERAVRVVLLEELDVRGHVRIDILQVAFVCELYDEHC